MLDFAAQVRNPAEASLITSIRSSSLTYLSSERLRLLAECIRALKKEKVEGVYVEAGVALGGSAILIASLKHQNTRLHLFDVFGMIPEPTSRDGSDAHERYSVISKGDSPGINGNEYYGYQENLKDLVKRNLEKFGLGLEKDSILLVEGLYQNTMATLSENVAFAHIDCDWYESVRVCIEVIAPLMSVNGIFVFDDYATYSGCRRAVDEFLQSDDRFSVLRQTRGPLLVIRRH